MAVQAPKFSIILAGGKGTRMRSADRHKVCFLLDGRPAINRALEVYQSSGIQHHIVVVGAMAGQVIETVGQEHAGAIFAYQAEQLGTAHATGQAAKVLEAIGEDSDVLVVAGDRVVDPLVLEQLFDLYYGQNCDLAFLVGPRGRRSDPGRVLLHPDGEVMGNVEMPDVRQRAILATLRQWAQAGRTLDREEILDRIRQDFVDRKAVVAFGDLWQVLMAEERAPTREEVLAWAPPQMTRFSFLDQSGASLDLTPAQVDATQLANYSVYLVKTSLLHYALAQLGRDNAQQEEYLSDLITTLAQARQGGNHRFRVHALQVDNPNYVMAFNDPAELLEIEEYLESKKQQALSPDLPASPAYQTIATWQSRMAQLTADEHDADESLEGELLSLYGDDPPLIQERVCAFQQVLGEAARIFGPDERVLLVRSPGRVNLMGRHVDHQGGHCNLMTIGYETLMVVHPRQDDQVWLHNLDGKHFPQHSFSIGELVADLPWDNWLSLVNSERVSQMVLNAGGDWSQYVKAAVLRLQKKFTNVRLRGIDLVVQGNIPIAAGLSSSSALVVATTEAMVAVNQLDTFPSQFIDLCGEGEWFVGTRGGSADHAAIKLGQRGRVVKVAFFPFVVEETVPFLDDYVLAVCDSGVQAPKTTSAKDQFNHRVACYHIGRKLVKRLFPQYAPLLSHLRDVNTRTLGVSLSTIYKILLRLPEQVTREQLLEWIPAQELDPLLASHRPPADGFYPVRGVVLYGLAEFERSRLYADLLRAGEIDEIGRLMQISHDGDRVSRLDGNGEMHPYLSPTSNGYLLDLIEDLESGEPARVVGAQLERQTGSYHCSIPAIDRMVDVSLSVEGVLGAQLAGAGLGGCMMVLAHKEAIPQLVESLEAAYYEPEGRDPAIMLCKPIAGSGILLTGGTAQVPIQ